jgi:GT2 family glycosyltransferase
MTSTQPETTRLLVVIVNYRTPDLTIDCLRSLESEVRTLGSTRVVVADNASGDGSVPRIRTAIEEHGWSRWASLLPLDRNGGFSFGNNAVIGPALEGVERPPPEFVLLLNSDTVVCPNALRALLEFMDSHPNVGIAGSRVDESDGTRQHSRYRFHTVWSELDSGLRLGFVTRLLRKHAIAAPLVDTAHLSEGGGGASRSGRGGVGEDSGGLGPG